ncbi:unnamed protein product, partial [Ectocarpus sp. 12 AP-2014]
MLSLASCCAGIVFSNLSKTKGITEIGLTPSGLAELVVYELYEHISLPRLFGLLLFGSDAIKANADKVKQFRSGKTKLQGFFVGQAVALSGGKADP